SVVSHFGPPTAASSTASAPRHASSVSSVRAVPYASIDAPPNGYSSYSSSAPAARSTSTAGPMTSGPTPSPGSRMTRGAMRSGSGSSARRHVQAHVLEHQRIAGPLQDALHE